MADWERDEQQWSRWLIQAQKGDEAAYAALLGELATTIQAYLVKRIGQLELLDDCVQECLIAIHQARHTYDGARPFRPWFFAIVRHRAIDLLRQHHNRLRKPEPSELEKTGVDLLQQITVGKLLQSLSKNIRDALILTKLWGYSTRETAQQLGVSESVIKVRVHRGVRQLKAIMEAENL